MTLAVVVVVVESAARTKVSVIRSDLEGMINIIINTKGFLRVY